MNLNNGYNNQKDSDQNTLESFKILISNIKYLKDKTWGCPWQKIQSHKSLIPFLNEESSEFIDAIYEKNANNICEELGDLLLQIMLHAEIGCEEKSTTTFSFHPQCVALFTFRLAFCGPSFSDGRLGEVSISHKESKLQAFPISHFPFPPNTI